MKTNIFLFLALVAAPAFECFAPAQGVKTGFSEWYPNLGSESLFKDVPISEQEEQKFLENELTPKEIAQEKIKLLKQINEWLTKKLKEAWVARSKKKDTKKITEQLRELKKYLTRNDES